MILPMWRQISRAQRLQSPWCASKISKQIEAKQDAGTFGLRSSGAQNPTKSAHCRTCLLGHWDALKVQRKGNKRLLI